MTDQLDDIFVQMRPYTMVHQPQYLSSLRLAQRAAEVLGAIVECGVYRGGMVAGIAKLLGGGRDYWLFDSFEGLPPATEADGISDDDGLTAIEWQKLPHGNCTAPEELAKEAMALAGVDYHLVKGWFTTTLPAAAGKFPDGIAMLRLDADWYFSTQTILDNFFPLVVPGGIIVVDDYYTWSGCAKALHRYLVTHDRPERIETEGRWWLGEGVCFLRKRADDG